VAEGQGGGDPAEVEPALRASEVVEGPAYAGRGTGVSQFAVNLSDCAGFAWDETCVVKRNLRFRGGPANIVAA
jgi:hypothetical protein